MPAQPGQTLSHYRLIEKIGEGGMGVVWKAEDTTLRRPVALKFFTEGHFDEDALRVRFLREARLAAALNHPSICSIHEIAEVEQGDSRALPSGEQLSVGTPYLAMEFIDGQPLNDVIRKSGALPVDDALRIATQVAEGLAVAHEQGIVHRDLKPGNVMLTPDERAKILDFGLAKHLWPTDPDDAVLTQAETVSEEVTRAGMVMGTVPYMSPEQARGQPLDSRSDIFSFGVMLYEMVVGQRPFRGETSDTTRFKIIEAEPEPLPDSCKGVPPELERIIWRCLRKKPAARFNDTRDLLLALEDLREESPSGRLRQIPSAASAETIAPVGRPWTRWRGLLPWAFVAALLLVLATVQVWRSQRDGGPVSASVTRFTVQMPEGERLTSFYRPGFAVSPDGRMLAFVSGPVDHPSKLPEVSRLFLRRFNEQEARPVRGTDGARWPVFSPDGRWIAFHTDRELKKVPVEGGQPVTLCETVEKEPFGLDWGPDGTIVFASESGGLKRVSASGGEPRALTQLNGEVHEVSHRLPNLLPGGEAVLYTSIRFKAVGYRMDRVGIFVESLRTGERKLLIEGGTDARYVSTGHLLFAREGRLMAAPFDVERLEITGPEVPVIEGVSHAIYAGSSEKATGAALLSVSPSGSLAYVPGSVAPPTPTEMLWIDRQGREEPLGVEAKGYLSGRVAADGQRVLLSTFYPPRAVWLFDIDRKTLRRQTFEGQTSWAIWGPGADYLTFDSDREGPDGLYWKPVDAGPVGVERLASGSVEYHKPSSWSPDGELLAFVVDTAETGHDIWIVPRSGEAKAFLRTRFSERYPEFSPDGRWLVYASNESGRDEVYVRPYPGPGRALQISTAGGGYPGWSRDGSEIFYRWQADFFAVRITIDGENLHPGTPVRLFDWRYERARPVRSWDVAPDGRFLVVKTSDADLGLVRDRFAPDRIHVVLNWFEELKRKTEAAQ